MTSIWKINKEHERGKMNIAVVHGGISPERNVSIAGGKAVIEALMAKGHNVIPIDPAFGREGLRKVEDLTIIDRFPTDEELSEFSPRSLIQCIDSELFDNIDIAFIVLHGLFGEDGKFQALLDLRGIPYTGSKVKASSVAIDKLSSKLLFTAAGLMTPPWAAVRKEHFGDYDYYEEVRGELGNHVVVKPNDQGSTIGISIVERGNLDDLHEAVMKAGKYSELVIVEQFIKGREITVGLLGEEALPPIEIIPESGFYDYEHKYTKGKTTYECPADIPGDIAEFAQNCAYTAFRVIGCEGFGRADFRMDEDGQMHLLEINTIPGFTATSLVPMAAAETGLDFPDLCEEIINIELGKDTENDE